MLTTKDAKQYLSESRVSLAVARERAAEGAKNSYWHAWAHSFMSRCRSLESVLPKLKKREAEAEEYREANGKASHPDVLQSNFPRLEGRAREAR